MHVEAVFVRLWGHLKSEGHHLADIDLRCNTGSVEASRDEDLAEGGKSAIPDASNLITNSTDGMQLASFFPGQGCLSA